MILENANGIKHRTVDYEIQGGDACQNAFLYPDDVPGPAVLLLSRGILKTNADNGFTRSCAAVAGMMPQRQGQMLRPTVDEPKAEPKFMLRLILSCGSGSSTSRAVEFC